jgi:IS30 family transposase
LQKGKDQLLLTLTEHKTRYEITIEVDGNASDLENQALATMKEAAEDEFVVAFQTY